MIFELVSSLITNCKFDYHFWPIQEDRPQWILFLSAFLKLPQRFCNRLVSSFIYYHKLNSVKVVIYQEKQSQAEDSEIIVKIFVEFSMPQDVQVNWWPRNNFHLYWWIIVLWKSSLLLIRTTKYFKWLVLTHTTNKSNYQCVLRFFFIFQMTNTDCKIKTAISALNGRFFNGNRVSATIYDQTAFDIKDYTGWTMLHEITTFDYNPWVSRWGFIILRILSWLNFWELISEWIIYLCEVWKAYNSSHISVFYMRVQ